MADACAGASHWSAPGAESCAAGAAGAAGAGGASALIFGALLASLATSQRRLGSATDYPPGHPPTQLRESYDFVVVGAGSAGAALAARLSEDSSRSVLLLEAGGDPPPDSDVPALFFALQNTAVDWAYRTEPDSKSCRGYKRNSCAWPRGKVLGGSSVLNAMIYIRGHKCDYDLWEALGNKGWSYEDILPYFKKSENMLDAELLREVEGATKLHGTGGPLNVGHYGPPSRMAEALVDASVELGFPSVRDMNTPESVGVGIVHGTVHQGVRWNVAKAFLQPAKDRDNLHITKNAHVTKVLIDESTKQTTGVRFRTHTGDGVKEMDIKVDKEVIVSAGAIGSPQLLMLSGIGPRKHLEEIGVSPIIADLPVGENLHDHTMYQGLVFSLDANEEFDTIDIGYQYLKNRTGMLSSIDPTTVSIFFHTDKNLDESHEEECVNAQVHVFFIPKKDEFGFNTFVNNVGLNDYIRKQMWDILEERNMLIITPLLLIPKSRGRVLLKSTDPTNSPSIISGYFHDDDDADKLVSAIEVMSKLVDTPTMRALGARLEPIVPDACADVDFGTRAFWRCGVTHLGNTVYHHVGTCKMGPASDAGAVVDARLRVHGVKGLRVADASIMPRVPTGNTNAPSIMVGEKAADLIKEDWA